MEIVVDINWLESRINWYLNIPNPYNRVRLISDKDLLILIDEKLKLNEAEYD